MPRKFASVPLFNDSIVDVVNYVNAEGAKTSVNEEYVNVVRFIDWLKTSNSHYYNVVNTLLWGSIVAGFLQRKTFEADIKIVTHIDYYLDTSIVLSVLGLDSEENIIYARDLVRIILESGSTPCVHALTLREIYRILQRVEYDQAPKPGTTIQHAWAEQNLCLSDILKIKSNIEQKLQNEFNISVTTLSASRLDEIEDKYRNNMDVKALAEERGTHGEDKLRDIHDVYMRDCVQKINKDKGGLSLENQSAYFVSLNKDMIAFANRVGQLESVIHASRVVMSLWIHSSSSEKIQTLALTETMSRCFALNQTDVRRKLRLFHRQYTDGMFTKDDVSNMYTSLIRRSTNTITEVERLEVIDKSEIENKDAVSQEIIQGILNAVKKEAEERTNAMSSMQKSIDELSVQIGDLDGILKEAQSGNSEKDSLIQQLQKEAETRNRISEIKDKIHQYKEELIPLNMEREKSVSFFKFWLIIVLEIAAIMLLLISIGLAILKWDKTNILNLFTIVSVVTMLGLIARLHSMYLLSPILSKTKIRKDQLDCWDDNHPRRKWLEEKIKDLEKDKKELEHI